MIAVAARRDLWIVYEGGSNSGEFRKVRHPDVQGKLVSRLLVGMARRAVRLLSTDALSAGLCSLHQTLDWIHSRSAVALVLARRPHHRGLGSSLFLASSFSLGDTSGYLNVSPLGVFTVEGDVGIRFVQRPANTISSESEGRPQAARPEIF